MLWEAVVPGGRRLSNWQSFIVCQDGATAHTARSTRARWAGHRGTELLKAGAQSPDANLSENL